jgi:hypothetical protein
VAVGINNASSTNFVLTVLFHVQIVFHERSLLAALMF